MNNRFVCARVSGPLGAPHLCLASSPHPGGGPVSAAGSLLPLPECPNDPRVGGQGSLADSLLVSGACPGNISLGLNRRKAGGIRIRGGRCGAPVREEDAPQAPLLLADGMSRVAAGRVAGLSRTREGTRSGPFGAGFGACLQKESGGLALTINEC